MKILLVEDESSFALILHRTLTKKGHTVTVTRDGVEAWAALQNEAFSLVISDWMMPTMDGPTLCKRIRARTGVAYTYVILLTSRKEREDRIEGLHSGADDFLSKPLARGELFARLEIAERILAMQSDLQRRAAETDNLNRCLQEQYEQVTALNAELEQFASIACHDLQEPLRKIQMFSCRLTGQCKDALGPQGAEFVDRIQAAAERMQALIRDLFTLTQVDRTDQPFIDVDLDKAVRDVVSDLEARIEETGGRVDIGALPVVRGDPVQIRQLLQNLIGNGLKYHRAGELPVVSVNASGAVVTRLKVSDNGIGFDEQYVSRIFAPFQRLHGRGEYDGTGIGLAICKKIVDRHGGSITARSSPGYGATFEVAFAPDSTTIRNTR